MNIEKEFDQFFEFPGEDQSVVSSVSARLFARHCVDKSMAEMAEHDAEVIEKAIKLYSRKTLDGDVIYTEGLQDYANQLRQKAQEQQS